MFTIPSINFALIHLEHRGAILGGGGGGFFFSFSNFRGKKRGGGGERFCFPFRHSLGSDPPLVSLKC